MDGFVKLVQRRLHFYTGNLGRDIVFDTVLSHNKNNKNTLQRVVENRMFKRIVVTYIFVRIIIQKRSHKVHVFTFL